MIESEDEIVYSTAEEEMWEEELQSRKEFELRTGEAYDAKPEASFNASEYLKREVLVQHYLDEIGLPETQVIGSLQEGELLNKHVIGFYKGRISMTEEATPSTIREIAETLADINIHFTKEFDQAWIKEFGEQEEELNE